MASSSSSSSTTASPADGIRRYDVFLSFRGEDTRNSFTDHLFDALIRAGLHTFRDDDEIERGEQVTQAIRRAIEASDASIVVLSSNYADSTWCLDELWLVLEERRVRNHFVLPVFYHVDPSDVSKDFMIQVKSSGTGSRWTVHNVNRWKAALTEVADLAGLVLSGPETVFLKKIVDTIYNKLDRKQVYLPPSLIGMDARVKEINSWLKQPDSGFLVICGMGGSGKTTLAWYVVYSNWQNFDNISIIEDIGSRCKEPHDLLQLQENLYGDILGGKKRKIPSVCQGTFKIEETLQKKRALIVLDDIVDQSHLYAFLGSGNINKQSKIIITTRENNTLKWFESRSWRCQEYKMKLLDDNESLELLSLHAFRSKIVMEGYKDLAKKVLKYCDGNPLALEVLGSSLQEDNSIASWKSALNLLEKDIHPGIHHVLIRSYNLLPYDTDRELFLHIACFFVGMDMDYVVKILEHEYSAMSRIKILVKRCLLSISPNKKLLMHPLIQEMGRTIVHQESPKDPAKRSRVWCNKESYDLLRKRMGSKTMEGLALDMKMLRDQGMYALKDSGFRTDSLKNMENLKLLQLKYVQLTGSFENFSEQIRWICWHGFHERTVPLDLFMENLVALDMSYSCLEIFELPMVLQLLKFLNLQDSHNLCEIHSLFLLPNLETLILWNCHSLDYVCETIGGLTNLVLLNMSGCENMCKSLGKIRTFSLPLTLQRLFLKDCYIECTDYIPFRFSVQSFLQYLNLGNSLFEFLPDYSHLKSLRVLDLTLCSRLKRLLCLPSTLAELYVYYCASLEKITFQSCQFTLQEFGYEGCTSLCEIEGFIELMPLVKLDEADLGHMKWLKEYQNHEVFLVGDAELTKGRSPQLQMLYEFNIMSTSLPDIKDANLIPEYISESPFLSFDVPLCPKDKRLKGLNITFKYTTSDDESWAWFAKISTTNGVDLMYNPIIFGKPAFGEVAVWLSYWPIGNTLQVGDKVYVSIIVVNGLEIRECGANLVYTDDEGANETMELVDSLGGGLSRFQLTTGAYYLCRRDFFELIEAGKGTPGWFRILVGDNIDYTEIRGWRKTGIPQPSEQSFTELKTIRCTIHGPESEHFYKIAEMSKSSFVNITEDLTSSIHETMKSVSLERRFQTGKNTQLHGEDDSKASSPNSSERVKLFVGQFPKHLTEAQLIAVFEEFIHVDEVCIIKDKATNASRGCCFVICPSREEADKAVDTLHNQITLPGASSPLQVKYADGELERLEHKLFIGMFPKNVSEEEVLTLFSQHGTIKDLQILRGSQETSKGCAFVKYETKEQAVSAIESLNGKHKMEGSTVPLVVKWADTEKERQARKAQKAQSRDFTLASLHPTSFGALPTRYIKDYGYQATGSYGLMQNQSPFPNLSPTLPNAFLYGGYPPDYYTGSAFPTVPRLLNPLPISGGIRPFSGSAPDHVEGPPGANLFIYHIPQHFGDEELANAFRGFGRVLSSKVFVDKATGVSKCIGFVSYDSPAAAQAAITSMNGFQLGGKKLKVQLKRDDKQNKPD
ncbi:disease resistance-like protein DSC1 [Bidens hawaiensis]|uniref:disease resistance-like protein DSC1 n=1 Tax=Bidens hawaiensis TaxID=980011 RepID=UPI00404B279A